MKRDKNRYRGNYLIEHNPDSAADLPYEVWDLRLIFRSDSNSFTCATLEEAEELCKRLAKLPS